MFTIGTDTEFFLENDGNLTSAIKLIKAGKHNPQILSCGGNVTHDNVALEFATPVANDEESFVAAIKATLTESLSLLPNGYKLNLQASADFPEKELRHDEAKQFGCDPDYCAWKLCVNEPPADAARKPFRTVGGHLHVGYVEGSGNEFLLDPMGKVEVVKAFDIVIGIPMTIFDHNKHAVARRKLYGKAGCHRPTNYGVEYRSLSNFWTFSPTLVRLVYQLAGEALTMVRDYSMGELMNAIPAEEVQRIINDGDAAKAQKLWDTTISPKLSDTARTKFASAKALGNIDIYKEWSI